MSRRGGKREEADPAPLTLGQRRTVWRANAPHNAVANLSGKGMRSVKGSIDVFTTPDDVDALVHDTERYLAWLKDYPR